MWLWWTRAWVPAGALGPSPRVRIVGWPVDSLVRTYGERAPGQRRGAHRQLGLLEVAVVEGNAAATLGLGVGVRVEVTHATPP